jgi:hypothetical protein
MPSGIALFISLLWTLRSYLRWRRASNEQMNLGEFEDPFRGDRLMRYTIAVFMIIVGWFLQEMHGQRTRPNELLSFWAPLLASVIAAAYAWELTLLVLALAAVTLLLYLIAQLPTSLAIVVGACIIAYAVYRTRVRG